MRDFLARLRFPSEGAGGGRLYTPRSRSACAVPPCGTPRSASAEWAWVSGTVAAQQGMALGIYWRRDRPFLTAHPRATDPRPRTRGRSMDAFTAGLLQRIRATETDLTRARNEGDDFLVEVEQGELDDLRRLAAEHGVEVSA